MLHTLHGKEKSQLNVILDSSNDNHVTFGLVNNLFNRDENLVLLCYHISPNTYRTKLKGDLTRISFHDGYSDPLTWNSKTNVISDVINKLKDDSTATVIIIDDLRLFERSYTKDDNWLQLFLLLRELSSVHPVFAFLNPNLIEDNKLCSLLHISSFNMRITSTDKHQLYKCESLLQKKSGKVVTEISLLSFKGDDLVISKQQNEKLVNVQEDEQTEVDPASNLTFNLRLTDSEKEARANIVLPYLLNNASKSSYLNNTSSGRSGGRVIYTPDDVDDFDDEDPDDDLDI